jgi:hypothetical protein
MKGEDKEAWDDTLTIQQEVSKNVFYVYGLFYAVLVARKNKEIFT